MTTKGFQVRYNAGKRPVATLVPLGALESIAHAAEVGLVKYWRDGYRDDGGYSLSQCLDSAARHIFKRTGGEKYDPDGSIYLGHPLDHLDMAIWNLSAACEAMRLYGQANDDLWCGPGTATKEMNRRRPENAELWMLIQLLDNVKKKSTEFQAEALQLQGAKAEEKFQDLARAEKLIASLTELVDSMQKKETK